MEFCIEYPKSKAGRRQWGKEYGLNAIYAGKHWSRRRADSEYWHSLTRAALTRAGIPQKPADKPVTIAFWWDDRLDLDNHAYMAKMIVDSLKGWVIQEDDRRCVKEIVHRWHDADYILVEVTDESTHAAQGQNSCG